MTWQLQYSPDIWFGLVAMAFLLGLGLYALRRRDVPGALPLAMN